MTYRNRKLLDLAHACPCHAQFKHDCEQFTGVEPAHADFQIYGRGHGHKSADWAFAAMCHPAHMMLDTFDRDLKQTEWTRAHVATQNYLWDRGLVKVV